MLPQMTYVVTFKYDLGGSVDLSSSKTRDSLGYPSSEPNNRDYDPSVYNLSYLFSREIPILLEQEPLVSKPVSISSILPEIDKGIHPLVEAAYRETWLYPQGILGIDYIFEFHEYNISTVRDAMGIIVKEKNRDYLPYLRDNLPTDKHPILDYLAEFPDSSEQYLFSNSEVVSRVRRKLTTTIEARPYRYVFHDYRQFLFVRQSNPESATVREMELRDIATMQYLDTQADDYEFIAMEETKTWAGRWVSSTLVDTDAPVDTERRMRIFFNHVHTNWFLCQLWIFALDDYVEKIKGLDTSSKQIIQELKEKRHEMDTYQVSIDYDLAEIFDVDILVKDYSHTRLLLGLFKSYNLHGHYDLLCRRRDDFMRYYDLTVTLISESSEDERRRQTSRLEFFFTILTVFSIGDVLFGFFASSPRVNVLVAAIILSCYFVFFLIRRDWKK
jgi:hypothetical protein